VGLSAIVSLLFAVGAPVDNLPFVQILLGPLSARNERRVISRELLIAFMILLGLALTGDWVLGLLDSPISKALGALGSGDLEKLMGLLLKLIALNMDMSGVRSFLGGGNPLMGG
jgi:small neutral amino acid transporter SnatA (MarC family)